MIGFVNAVSVSMTMFESTLSSATKRSVEIHRESGYVLNVAAMFEEGVRIHNKCENKLLGQTVSQLLRDRNILLDLIHLQGQCTITTLLSRGQ